MLPKGRKQFPKGRKEHAMDQTEQALPHNHNEDADILTIANGLNRIDKFEAAAYIFKQLGDASRVRLFWLLCHCEECVINLSAMLEMSSPAVSHHLRLLKNSGLVVSRRDGKEVYYRAADTEQSQLLHKTIEKVIEISCQD